MSSHCPAELAEATQILAACYADTHAGQLLSELGDNTVLTYIQECIEQNRRLLCQAKVGLVEKAMLAAHKSTCMRAWDELQEARLRMHMHPSTNNVKCDSGANGEAHEGQGNAHTGDGPRIFLDPLFASFRPTDRINAGDGSNAREMLSANYVCTTGHGKAWQEAPTVIVGGHGHRGAVLVKMCGEHEVHRDRGGADGAGAERA